MIDTSASMQRAGLWQQALDKARDVLADLQRGDELAIVTFDNEPKTLLGFEQSSRMTTEQIVATADNLLPKPRDLASHRHGSGNQLRRGSGSDLRAAARGRR